MGGQKDKPKGFDNQQPNQPKKEEQKGNVSFSSIQNELKKELEMAVGKDETKILKRVIDKVTIIQQKTENLKEELLHDFDKVFTSFEDPFDFLLQLDQKDLKAINKGKMMGQIVGLILKDPAIKNYLAMQSSNKGETLRVEKLKEIANSTEDKKLKSDIEKFLKGKEDLKDPNSEHYNTILEKLKGIIENIRNELKKHINIESIFQAQPDLKQKLAYEIRSKLSKGVTIEDYEDDAIGGEEVEVDEYSKNYPVIQDFYRNHLTHDKINKPIILDNQEYDALLSEMTTFFNEQNESEYPNLKLFFDGFLKIKKTTEEVIEEPIQENNENTGSEDKEGENKKEEKPEKDTSGLIYGCLASLGMQGMDLGFKILMTMIFSPVSAAIWASQERLKMGKGGMNINTKGWEDIFPGSALDPDKDKKK